MTDQTQETMGEERPRTAADMLAMWDAGEIVPTVEMGGLGPGYEQAIHVLVFEIIRDYAGQTLPDTTSGSTKVKAWWDGFGEDAIKRSNASVGGYSGAQVGCAKNLAFNLLRKGWDTCRAEVGAERTTMVSRHWPKAPEA